MTIINQLIPVSTLGMPIRSGITPADQLDFVAGNPGQYLSDSTSTGFVFGQTLNTTGSLMQFLSYSIVVTGTGIGGWTDVGGYFAPTTGVITSISIVTPGSFYVLGAHHTAGSRVLEFTNAELPAFFVMGAIYSAITGDGGFQGLLDLDDNNYNGSAAADAYLGGDGFDQAYGGGGSDTLDGGAGNDGLFGGAGSDVLYGGNPDGGQGSGNDSLWGGEGADAFFGGNGPSYATGRDLAMYTPVGSEGTGFGNLVIRLNNPALNTGEAAGDTYHEIDGLVGGHGNDTIVGDGQNNYLGGSLGADMIYGGVGNDTVVGDDGVDHLWGGAGADHHEGGAGIDYARYDDANYGNLMIRLGDEWLNTGAAAGDFYVGIEGLVGGAGNDSVYGNSGNDYLFGSGGNDLIYGRIGNDFLSGDAGGDNLWGGSGADAHYGGDGLDYARYDDADRGNLTLRLDNAALNAGAGAVGDTYTGIEGLVGGAGADVIIGNASVNYLFGQGGADYIDGLGGSDYLNGGAGADRFRFSTALSGSNVDHVADFQHLVDDILLLQSVFAGIGPTLTADEFRIGMAQDANDRILYNPGTGQIYYDSNANVAGGMMLFATVTAGTVLTFDDFIMV
jgi:Ca2+-binding RTX toxin-like protein